MKQSILIALGVASTGLAIAASAPVGAPSIHWYVGTGINHYSGLTERSRSYNSDGDVMDQNKLTKTDMGYNLFVGNCLTQHFGTELGVNILGDRTYKSFETNKGDVDYDKVTVHHGWGVYYDGVLTMPLYSNFLFVYGNTGINYANAKAKITSWTTGSNPVDPYKKGSVKFSSFGWNYGAGIKLVYDRFGARINYTHLNFTKNQEYVYDTPNVIGADVFYMLS